MPSPEEEIMKSYERAMDTMNGLKAIIEEQKKTIDGQNETIKSLEDELMRAELLTLFVLTTAQFPTSCEISGETVSIYDIFKSIANT